jgi:GNAT superfamily N-acetyltransferase
MDSVVFAVRGAVVDDAEAIGRIHVGSWLAFYRGLVVDSYLDTMDVAVQTRRWREVIEDRAPYDVAILVALAGDTVIGFAGAGHSRDGDDDPEEVGDVGVLYVDPERTGTGIGGLLLSAAISALQKAFLAEATLWVIEGNSRARRFYERHGWQADEMSKRCSLATGATHIRYRTSLVRRRLRDV